MAPLQAAVEVENGSYQSMEPRYPIAIFSSMPYFVLALGALSLAIGMILYFMRTRRSLHASHSMTSYTEYVILDSEVSIEIGDQDFEFEYDDPSYPKSDIGGRGSFETILDGTSPHRMAFNINQLPHIKMGACRSGNLLERRGQRTLILRPSENWDADMAIVDFQNGKLTFSPFTSRKDGQMHGMDLPKRRRTPRFSDNTTPHTSGLATAPHNLQSHWRPFGLSSPLEEK